MCDYQMWFLEIHTSVMEKHDLKLDLPNLFMLNHPSVYLNYRYTSDVDNKHEVWVS